MIGRTQDYMKENLGEKISLEKLSSKRAITRRNFGRRFIKATVNTPDEYMQRLKMEAVNSALEKGRKSIFETMDDVGYSDGSAFRFFLKDEPVCRQQIIWQNIKGKSPFRQTPPN